MTAPALTRHVNAYVTHRRQLGRINPATARSVRYTLGLFAESYGERPVRQLSRVDVERWLAQQSHLAPSSRRLHLSRVRTFGRWLVLNDVIRRDPTLGIEDIAQPRRVERGMPHDDIAAVLDLAPDLRARAMLRLMVGCGLRCVEVARLGHGDYDRRDRVLRVVGKGLNEREVPVPAEVAAVLDAYLDAESTSAGPLFRNRVNPSRGLTAATVSRYTVRWMRAAGVKARAHDGVSAHALRHTAASDVLDRCDDIRVVQAMLGHQAITTTERYVRRPRVEGLREAMEGRKYEAGASSPAPHAIGGVLGGEGVAVLPDGLAPDGGRA